MAFVWDQLTQLKMVHPRDVQDPRKVTSIILGGMTLRGRSLVGVTSPAKDVPQCRFSGFEKGA